MKYECLRVHHLLALAIFLAVAVGCSDSGNRRSVLPPSPTDPVPCTPGPIAGELIVTFVPTATETEARRVVTDLGLVVLRVSLGFSAGLENRWLLVGVPAGSESFWIAELLKSPLVTIAEQNATICLF